MNGEDAHSVFQTRFWGEFKSRFGWTPRWVRPAGRRGDTSTLMLTRAVAPGVRMGYVPYPDPGLELSTLAPAPEAEPEPEALTVLRIDPLSSGQLTTSGDGAAVRRLRKAPVDVQPPTTTVLDLSPDEESLLRGMKSKTRYNIRLAGRRGVTVREAGPEELGRWYSLYQETAARDRIAIHRAEYYRSLFEIAAEHPDEVELSLLLAEHEGDLLAGVILGSHGGETIYLYGASANIKRTLMASHLLQWEAIRRARAAGSRRYDFFGIPPAADPKHPMYGLYRFKVGFGGAIVERPGSWDLPLRRFRYAAFRRAELLRQYYYKVLRKGSATRRQGRRGRSRPEGGR